MLKHDLTLKPWLACIRIVICVSLEVEILMPQPPKFWNYRPVTKQTSGPISTNYLWLRWLMGFLILVLLLDSTVTTLFG